MSINEQIIYYYRNGYRIKEIAAKTGLSEETVKHKLCQLRKERQVKRWWEE